LVKLYSAAIRCGFVSQIRYTPDRHEEVVICLHIIYKNEITLYRHIIYVLCSEHNVQYS